MRVTHLRSRNLKRVFRNCHSMIPRLLIVLLVLTPALVRSQVVFTSPLPDGVLQVHGDHADLRLHVILNGYSNFSFKLSSSIDTSSFTEGWVSDSVKNGIVDTILTVPKSLLNYGLYWRTGLSITDIGGEIANLTPGH